MADLWLLFSEAIPGEQLRILAHAMVLGAGISDAKLEIFPKQSQPGKLGSQVRLPLGVNRKPSANGSIGWFQDCAEENILAQLQWLVAQPLNDSRIALRLAEQHKPLPKPIYLKPRNTTNQTGLIDFLQYAHEHGFKQDGDYFRGKCPSCAEESHDADDNHLWVHAESGATGCWRGCSFIDIVRAIKFGKLLAI